MGVGGEPNKIFVGGLSQDITANHLRSYFERHGDIENAVVMKDCHTNRSRGFGFVVFKNVDLVASVLEIPHSINGRKVDCKRASQRSSAPKFSRHNCVDGSSVDKVFVGGLPDVTQEEFREYFEQFGAVTDAVLMTDKGTGKLRGFGFVTFESNAAIAQVMSKFTEHNLKGKWIEVKRATPKDVKQPSATPSSGFNKGNDHGKNGRGRDLPRLDLGPPSVYYRSSPGLPRIKIYSQRGTPPSHYDQLFVYDYQQQLQSNRLIGGPMRPMYYKQNRQNHGDEYFSTTHAPMSLRRPFLPPTNVYPRLGVEQLDRGAPYESVAVNCSKSVSEQAYGVQNLACGSVRALPKSHYSRMMSTESPADNGETQPAYEDYAIRCYRSPLSHSRAYPY